MSFLDDDLDVFFDDFTVDALCGVNTFPVIFDEDAKDYDEGAVVTSTGPVIRVKASDASLYELKKGDVLTIEEKSWKISSPGRIDGPGIRIFKLQEA